MKTVVELLKPLGHRIIMKIISTHRAMHAEKFEAKFLKIDTQQRRMFLLSVLTRDVKY